MNERPPIHIFSKYNTLAREFFCGRTFIAFDTETTGLHASDSYMIEIGAVKFNCDGIIGEPFDILIKPPVPVPAQLEELTHITNDMLKDCPGEETAVKAFLEYIEDDYTLLAAHNAPFDLYFMNAALIRSGLAPLKNICIDTLPLSKWAYPSLTAMNIKGTFKLQSLAQRFNIEVKAAHRADDDARVCMEVLKRIVEDSLPRQKDYKQAQEEKSQLSLF
ncbi:DNA polymerase-3 subunit epsilon [Treponema rectale]|uniref:DNA polymerase-3 subunit epsilon n=1 Tax=Treponema rectale TaxID=744512 RepID=A0A840SJN0_9SPIR|nr:3'-5' exonuclease [Treponema rectale]MBB5219581.1 DNA polymerase-3 subunit epsilon [Treponema rectale]